MWMLVWSTKSQNHCKTLYHWEMDDTNEEYVPKWLKVCIRPFGSGWFSDTTPFYSIANSSGCNRKSEENQHHSIFIFSLNNAFTLIDCCIRQLLFCRFLISFMMAFSEFTHVFTNNNKCNNNNNKRFSKRCGLFDCDGIQVSPK